MPIVNHICGQCALWQHMGGTCPIMNKSLEPNNPSCPSFKFELKQCEICNNYMLDYIMDITEEGKIHYICDQCNAASKTCATCKHTDCLFQTDPSPIPKTIQKQFRQGNTVMIAEVANPERIDKFCRNKCICFDEELGCLKQNNTCGKYKMKYLPTDFSMQPQTESN